MNKSACAATVIRSRADESEPAIAILTHPGANSVECFILRDGSILSRVWTYTLRPEHGCFTDAQGAN